MTLTPGTQLGPYEVLGPLGAGGMGEVYRARDTRLGREVAIKALPAEFAHDAERLARFEREAKLLASLSHPNIAGILGLEEVGGARYLVLEFVEGESLAQRLARGALAVDDSLDVARQIAAGVEAAHESGVVHRDLKPGNVMLTSTGAVKVLDFGLAKGGGGANSGKDVNISASPTMTYAATQAGVILGTAAYMSPEQARGKPLDKRTDIWSFGCVLYECLAGRQAFEGETVSDLIARILERAPDLNALPAGTPARARELLARCLEKDARKRLRDAGDARIELEAIQAARAQGETGPVPAQVGRPRSRFASVANVATIVLAAVAATLFTTRFLAGPQSHPVSRFEVLESAGSRLYHDPAMVSISPDGETLAFIASDSSAIQHVWLRPIGTLAARELPGTEGGSLPFWSPDGKSLGFFAEGKLKKIALAGGAAEVLCDAPVGRGGSWGSSGEIVFSPTSQGTIFRIPAGGGVPRQVTVLDSSHAESAHRFPRFLPDGDHFLYCALSASSLKLEICAGSLGSAKRVRVLSSPKGAEFALPGYLLYTRGAALVAQRLDIRTFRMVGDPLLLDDQPGITNMVGCPQVTASRNGTIAYVNNPQTLVRLVEVDRSGKVLKTSSIPPASFEQFTISPDARQAVLSRTTAEGGSDLWMADPERGTATRFTTGPGDHALALWSPDGRQVLFMSTREGPQNLYLKPASGSAPEEPLVTAGSQFKRPYSWSPDGRFVVFGQLDVRTGWDLWVLPMEGVRKPVPYLRSPAIEENGDISPDGRWMTYESDETGRTEIYVQSFPVPGTKYQVTTDGGFAAGWTPDGKRVLYAAPPRGDVTMSVELQTQPDLRVIGAPQVFSHVPPGLIWFSATRGLSRVFALLPAARSAPASIVVLSNWTGAIHKR